MPTARCLAVAVGLALLATGCKLVEGVVDAPGAIADAATGKKPAPPPIDPDLIRTEVRRLADEIVVQVKLGTKQFAEQAGTPAARHQALSWMLDAGNRSLAIAAGPQPSIAFVDLVVYVTVRRAAHESYFGPKLWGDADRPMVAAWQGLEQAAWRSAEAVLTADQRQELRATLDAWQAENQEITATSVLTVPSFLQISKQQKGSSSGVFSGLGSMLSVDPLQGLEPVAREAAELRDLGERVLYLAQRTPPLVALQLEFLTWNLTAQPDVKQTLEDVTSVTRSIESLTATASSLPAALTAEREAALKQIAQELTAQREGLVADLERAREPVQQLLAEARGALEAGTALSTALDATIHSADGLIARFTPAAGAAEDTPPVPAQPAAEEPPGRPFDINEYANAATQLAAAARELGVTIATLDRSLPEVQKVLDEAALRADRSVERALGGVLRIALVLVAAIAVAVLLVRALAARVARRPVAAAGP